jgi:hypothetical protein
MRGEKPHKTVSIKSCGFALLGFIYSKQKTQMIVLLSYVLNIVKISR